MTVTASFSEKLRARLIAFYLPQFHPIPENDAWWGKGFTEWTNVTRARPLFAGHRQPRVPGELGYYDLRDPAVRTAQATLAREHGIEAFCYWHYWFGGRRLLERPFAEVLASGEPDFPFCLAWANESWTGVWHGAPKRILMQQTYPGEDDDRRHFDFLLTAFHDRRYVRVDDKPLLVIYKPMLMPQPQRRLDLWRTLAQQAGLPGLHIVGFNMDDFADPAPLGLDATIVYRLGQTYAWAPARKIERMWWGLRRRMPAFSQRRIAYARALRHHLPDPMLSHIAYPCVVPNWDNSPRAGKRALILTDDGPEAFRAHLRAGIDAVAARAPAQRLVFIKAWNEWAEGNYLEPDDTHGRAYLEVVRDENGGAW